MDSGYQSQGRPQTASLFVGGLAFSATEHELRAAFEQCGTITNCRIVTDRETGRSKGFGFIDFSTQEELDGALQTMQGASICGRPVRLDAGGRGKGGKGGAPRPAYQQGGSYGGNRDYNQGQQYSRQPQGGYDAPAPSGGQYSSGHHESSQGGYNSAPHGGYSSGYQAQSSRPQYNDQRSDDRYNNRSYESRSGGYNQSDSRGYNQSDSRSDNRGGYSSSQTQGYSRGGYQQPSSDRVRSRSRSETSSTKERRQRERHTRKEQFAKSNQGWDRAPTREEMAQQEVERAAVHAAEAQGKDITTIRADLLKQASSMNAGGQY